MSELKVFIDTGLEYNTELIDAHDRFVEGIQDVGATVIGDRSRENQPETPQEEAEYERDRLETIAEEADAVALWLDGQPPRPRSVITAGFAAAKGIPVFAMRSEQRATTGENGIPFNLMIPAAISYSRDPSFGYESEEIVIAQNIKQLAAMILAAKNEHGVIPKTIQEELEMTDEVYAASPYGFAPSTQGFYNKTVLPSIDVVVPPVDDVSQVKDPWTYADKEVKIALGAEPGRAQNVAWTMVGIRHLRSVGESRAVVANVDQEPSDAGTIIETGAGAGFGKPVALHRGDFRVVSEGPSRYEASVQAAANLWLPRDEAIEKHDKFPDSVEKMQKELQQILAEHR